MGYKIEILMKLTKYAGVESQPQGVCDGFVIHIILKPKFMKAMLFFMVDTMPAYFAIFIKIALS